MNKKGEMPWMLVLLILAVLFLATMSFVSGGIIKKAVDSITGIQSETGAESKCIVFLDQTQDKDGDGHKDTKECDCDLGTNPTTWGPKCPE